MDEHLAAVVAHLAGPFTTAQAAECGVTHGQLRRAVTRGDLVSPHAGVFVDPVVARTAAADPRSRHLLEVRCALLTSSLDTVASHRSAAAVRGWAQLGPLPPRPQLVRPVVPGRTPSGSEVKGVRVAALPPGHCTLVNGIPTTSDSRTLVDVARELPFVDGVVIADSAFARVGRPPDLDAVLSDCAGWPGIRRARQVLTFADARSESALESIGRVRVHEAGLPAPALQVWISDGVDRCRADMYWEEYRVIGEADGMLKYTSPLDLRQEKLRQEWLANLDNTVVRFTYADVMNPRRIPATMDRFRRALERGGLRRSA